MKKIRVKIKSNLFIGSDILWIVSIIFLAILTLFSFYKFDYLNQRFFFDSSTIAQFIQKDLNFILWSSLNNTALLYKILGISNYFFATIFGLFISVVIFFILLFKNHHISIINYLFLLFFSLLSAVYLHQYTKEVLVVIVVSFLLLEKTKYSRTLFLFFAIIYAFFFRSYWLLILGFTFGFMFFDRYIYAINNRKSLVLVGLIGLLFLSILMPIFFDVGLNHYRSLINIYRIGSPDVSTMIFPFIPLNSFLMEFINASITWVMLMFPLPLLLKFKIYYFVIFIMISVIFLKFWKDSKILLQNKQSKFLVFLIISFNLIQSIFEPDYGSFLKHLCPIMILMLYVGIIAEKLQNNQSNSFS